MKTNMKGKKRNKRHAGKSGTKHNPNGEMHWSVSMTKKQKVKARLGKLKELNKRTETKGLWTYEKLCNSWQDPSKSEAERKGWI